MTRLLPVLVVVLLAGCGGSSGSGGGDAGVKTAQSVADKLGCTNVAVDSAADRTAIASDTASCTLGGDTIYISTFTNNQARDNFVKVGTSVGGARMQVGDREVVYGDNATTADAIKAKLGGSIRTS